MRWKSIRLTCHYAVALLLFYRDNCSLPLQVQPLQYDPDASASAPHKKPFRNSDVHIDVFRSQIPPNFHCSNPHQYGATVGFNLRLLPQWRGRQQIPDHVHDRQLCRCDNSFIVKKWGISWCYLEKRLLCWPRRGFTLRVLFQFEYSLDSQVEGPSL